MEDIFLKKNCFKENEHVSSVLKWGRVEDCPNPVVSVIMPAYKRPDTFCLSLQSVLTQDFQQPYEVVVVDNYDGEGESPNLQVVKDTNATNVTYYHNDRNLGLFGNWNRGIELARAEYVTYCHDDDLLLPTCLSRLMHLQKQTGKKCILSEANTIDENGDFIRKNPYPLRKMKILKERDHYEYTLYDQFLGSRGFGVGCLFCRDAMLELGGYNKENYPSSDYALHAAYTYYYGCVYNAVPTFNYRIASNESLKVYEGFADADRFFRQCMIGKLKYPKWWLNMIINANYRISKTRFAVEWGNKSAKLYNEIRTIDKFIIKVASFWHRYKIFEIRR